MRVLHCIPNFLSGGAQQQLSYLVGEQKRSGLDVHVAYVLPGPKLGRFERSGAALHRLAARGSHAPGLFSEMRRLVERLDPEVVQTWLLQMDFVGGLAARQRKKPWILTERASSLAYARGLKPRARAWLGRRADAIVANSRAGDAYWRSRVPPAVLLRVIPNAVPFEELGRVVPKPDATLALPEGNRLVLYAGRFSPEKNMEALVPALGELAARIPMTAYLCGDGTHEAETRERIARLEPEADVRFAGYADDVWSFMKRADVFVSVSHFEGHPNTVLEAAASGCPLVLSDIPEHRAMLTDKEALFVDRESPAAIANALERVLRDPAGAGVRANAARTAVRSLSVDAMARSYGELYGEVLERRASKVAP